MTNEELIRVLEGEKETLQKKVEDMEGRLLVAQQQVLELQKVAGANTVLRHKIAQLKVGHAAFVEAAIGDGP